MDQTEPSSDQPFVEKKAKANFTDQTEPSSDQPLVEKKAKANFTDQTESSSDQPFVEEQAKENFFTRCLQKRFVLAVMGFWCFCVLSALRMNISLAIVAMVNWTEVRKKQGINVITYETCHYVKTEERPSMQDGPFIWRTPDQGHILSAYFYGLAATQLLGGRLSELLSAKWVLLTGTLVATLSTFLVPVTASNDPFSIIVLQVCKGFGQGILMPAFSVLMGKWVPAGERVRFVAFVSSGAPIGAFLTVVISGVICKLPNLGWKYVFYVFGAFAAVWCVFWIIVVYDSPLYHPRITRRELNRIMSLRTQQAPILHLSFPLKPILTSKPVWAYCAAGFASFWCLSLYASVVPLFMGTILKFEIEKNGTMSSIPNLLEAFFLFSSSLVSDYLLKRKILSATVIRKIFISTGLVGYALCMIAVTFAGCHRVFSVFFLVLALGMSGFSFASTAVVAVDMSPRFAGTLSGIMSTFGALSGVAIPEGIGYLTRERQTMDEWSIMFYISAAICITATLIFLVYGSSEKQPWDTPPLVLPRDSEGNIFENENLDKSTSDTLHKNSDLQRMTTFISDTDYSSNQAGPSSQSGLTTSREPAQKEEVKESIGTPGRPWRTDSFLNIPRDEPGIIIPLSLI